MRVGLFGKRDDAHLPRQTLRPDRRSQRMRAENWNDDEIDVGDAGERFEKKSHPHRQPIPLQGGRRRRQHENFRARAVHG